jgi:hypothetical protein
VPSFQTLFSSSFALALNRFGFGKRAEFELNTRQSWREAFAILRS